MRHGPTATLFPAQQSSPDTASVSTGDFLIAPPADIEGQVRAPSFRLQSSVLSAQNQPFTGQLQSCPPVGIKGCWGACKACMLCCLSPACRHSACA